MSNEAFKRNFAKLLDAAGDKAELVVRSTAEGLLGAIVNKTPVDVGGLVANWNLSLDEPDLNNTSPASVDPMQKARARLVGFKMGQRIFLVNNMPYAKRIEFDGWSKEKAPQGMVRITVLEYSQILRRNIQRLKNGG